MKRAVWAVVVAMGMLASPAAFAGQLNALGQWVPTSTHEALTMQDGRVAVGQVTAQGSGQGAVAAALIGANRAVHYRVDSLGRQVLDQTNHPWVEEGRVARLVETGPGGLKGTATPPHSERSIPSRLDGLGRQVPAHTNLP